MNSKVKKTVNLCLLICFISQSGLLLFCIQVVGWTKMVADLSEYVPVEQAIDLIVSGDEVCGICNFVSAQERMTMLTDHYLELQKIKLLTVAIFLVTIGTHEAIDRARPAGVDCIPYVFYDLELPPPKC